MITVFGSINMDLIATTPRLPKPGETLAGRSFTTAAGGKGANQALAARRAGAQVALCGAVGDDAFADGALGLLSEAGTDLSRVRRVEGATGTASILVGDEDGENVIVVVAAANDMVSPDDARNAIAAMSRGDILLLQLEVPAPSVEAALTAAREAGVTTILNTAPLTSDAARLAALADIVIANETEFALLIEREALGADEREAEMMTRQRETGRSFIVTLGADGVVAAHEGALHKVQGLKIKPVDTVGAGDTFCGYLAAGLDTGLALPEALRLAAAAGSLACLKPGAQPSIPLADAVTEALSAPFAS
ncbi:ribokinase [Pararhizobium haloflavum]|uniref:ribokinase n=1 Tax=Pararhizobium haloflavum TaxID=2037914 RepID=UPI000C19F19D|nr:ribokinase [Pararhizobium haloflavum]